MKLKLPILGLLMTLVVGILAACGGDATAVPRVIEVEVEVTPVPAPLLTNEQAATAFTTALNSGDLAAFNELLADDFVFTQVPGPGGTEKLTLTGKTAYLLRLAGLIENNTQLTVSEVVYEGERGTGKYSVTADNLRAIGVDSVSGTFENNRRNGKLVALDLVTDGQSLQKLGAALAALAPPGGVQLGAAFETALAAGDLAAFNDILGDEFVFTQVPGPGGTDKLTLDKSGYLLRLAGLMEDNQVLTLSEQVEEGDTTTGKFSVTGDNFRALGIGALNGTFVSTVSGGKLV